MKFTSLQEYFYKLQNVLYILILLPLIAFIFLIVKQPELVVRLQGEEIEIVTWALVGVIITDWLVITFLFNYIMKKISKEVALSTKLDRYYQMAVVRFSVIMISCMIMAAGYYLTGNVVFLGLFAFSLLLDFLFWPRSSAVCKDLKLKGDEREMVLYKKDRF